eukprot:CAMPEP_0185264324 /NCGR_PEP_ID=MMETSP1359-20130426/21957_1 /TAXON_ID=552665 /ORGANISM="Bigelowiella longifila, Strain CCMP242" /LENGTH=129 /DNA_ID=CAMNT_0027852801 /DNA_START=168 /DNA_END=554 /DNA_ORIENTATION=-
MNNFHAASRNSSPVLSSSEEWSYMRLNVEQDFSFVVLATLLHFILCETALVAHAVIKLGEMFASFSHLKRHLELADRTVGNFTESTALFLGLLWMYSLFISAQGGGKAGLLYVFFRSMYPVMWSLKGEW